MKFAALFIGATAATYTDSYPCTYTEDCQTEEVYTTLLGVLANPDDFPSMGVEDITCASYSDPEDPCGTWKHCTFGPVCDAEVTRIADEGLEKELNCSMSPDCEGPPSSLPLPLPPL